MLEAMIYAKSTKDNIMVKKFRHNDKAKYEVLIDGELSEAEMNELINGLIAMRDSE